MDQSDTIFSAFISYATKNKSRADELCASLEARGFRCWIAPRDIRAGHEYADEIIRGIEQSRCMVVVVSHAANESPFVRREVERAVSKKKPIFPVRIEEVLPSPGLELFISATHWIDAFGSQFNSQLNRLATDMLPYATIAPPKKWHARLRLLQQRAQRWGLIAASVILAALVIAFGGRALIDGLKTARGTGAGATLSRSVASQSANPSNAPARAASTLGTLGTESESSAPATTGATSDALLEPFKQRALNDQTWMQCADWFCSFPRLSSWFAGVRRISFGESRESVNRSIEIAVPADATERSLNEMANNYRLDLIPIRPGADSIFVRLNFYDGTVSPVRVARIQPPERTTMGLALNAIDGPSGVTAPHLFAGYTLGDDSVRFMPDAPIGSTMAFYSFDGGGGLPSPTVARNRTDRGFRFHGTPGSKPVQVEFRMNDGRTLGPFRYDGEEATRLVMSTMKESLLGNLHSLVRCTRIEQRFTEKSLAADRANASDNEVRRVANTITSKLRNEGLTFVTRGPVVACRADWQTHQTQTRGYLGDWAAVDEIRYGTTPGRLRDEVKNGLTMADVLAKRIPRSEAFVNTWNFTVPVDTEGVYVVLRFRDGTESPEVRVPIGT